MSQKRDIANSGIEASGPKFERRRRRKFENGKVVEYYEDVPVVDPSSEMPKQKGPVELYKEFRFEEDISLGRIFPCLKGTRYDAFVLTNTVMIWLGRDASESRKAGLWFETDMLFQGMLSPVADVLRDVFKQEKPGLHLQAHLGIQREVDDEMVASGFKLKGSIEGINVNFGDILMFRNASIAIDVVPDKMHGTETVWSFGGTLHLKIPNSTVPLVMEYNLTPKLETLYMTMTFKGKERWSSVFGVSGLNLDQVVFETRLVKTNLKRALEFTIGARWSLGDTPVTLTGHFSNDDAYLKGYVETLRLDDIRKLYSSMTGGGDLDPVQQDIEFRQLTIEISKGRLLLSGQATVGTHKVAQAEVLVSVDGVRISGAVDDIHVGEDVFVKEARLELVIGSLCKAQTSQSMTVTTDGLTHSIDPLQKRSDQVVDDTITKDGKSGTSATAIIRGKVQVHTERGDLDFDVVAAVSRPSKGPSGYFVYGDFRGENLSIGQLLPDGTIEHDHPMNLYLNSVVIMACSVDKVDDCGLNFARYPVKKGVFVCAQISSMPYVKKLSKDVTDKDCYVLQAGYSQETGLSVRINLPENIRIEFSPTFVSGPLHLLIETKPHLLVQFGAVLWYKPDGQNQPLQFTLALNANSTQAAAFAQMDGWWLNPLDLSPRLKIGPRLTLEVEVIYEQFLATGLPSGVGFEGGFVVDDIDEYGLAFNLGTNPKELLVKVKATQFDARQVINLVNAAAELEIDQPKEDMLRFENVDVYASPLGCLIGTQAYPPGFAVKGKAFIFGKKVEIDCSLGKSGLKLKGEIDEFTLGPLAIRGGRRADGSRTLNPLIDLELTKERQHFEVSGSITLWDLEASIFVLAEVFPNTQLEFNFELAWSDLLKFQVDGKLIRPEGAKGEQVVCIGRLGDADFQLHALMEQKILASVAESMQKWFKSASQSVHEGIDEAKRKLDTAKKEFDEACKRAEQVVEDKRVIFNQRMEEAQAGLRTKQQEIAGKRAEAEKQVIAEEKRAAAEIATAQAVLDEKQKSFQDDMEQTKRDLASKRRDAEDSLDEKIHDLQDKRVSIQESFGDATRAIQEANDRVRENQGWVDEAQGRLDSARCELSNAAWYEKAFKAFQVTALEAERFAKQCALDAASMILRAAKAIVEGPAYHIAQGAITLAESALALAREALNAIISGMQSVLDGVVAIHAGVIQVAKSAVATAEEVALEITKAAYTARDLAFAALQVVLQAAEEVVAGVAKGVDAIAFQTALAALEFARKDTTLIDVAKAGLDAAEAVAQAALKAASWLADKLCSTLDIQLIELSASLRGICTGQKGGFTIKVKGVVFNRIFDLEATWSPKDTLSFIIQMCQRLWDMFMQDIKTLFVEEN